MYLQFKKDIEDAKDIKELFKICFDMNTFTMNSIYEIQGKTLLDYIYMQAYVKNDHYVTSKANFGYKDYDQKIFRSTKIKNRWKAESDVKASKNLTIDEANQMNQFNVFAIVSVEYRYHSLWGLCCQMSTVHDIDISDINNDLTKIFFNKGSYFRYLFPDVSYHDDIERINYFFDEYGTKDFFEYMDSQLDRYKKVTHADVHQEFLSSISQNERFEDQDTCLDTVVQRVIQRLIGEDKKTFEEGLRDYASNKKLMEYHEYFQGKLLDQNSLKSLKIGQIDNKIKLMMNKFSFNKCDQERYNVLDKTLKKNLLLFAINCIDIKLGNKKNNQEHLNTDITKEKIVEEQKEAEKVEINNSIATDITIVEEQKEAGQIETGKNNSLMMSKADRKRQELAAQKRQSLADDIKKRKEDMEKEINAFTNFSIVNHIKAVQILGFHSMPKL
jgi:hypothetical protein